MLSADQLLVLCNRLLHLDDEDVVKSECIDALDRYGIKKYIVIAHSEIIHEYEPNIVSTNFPKEWVKHYIASSYMDHDPIYIAGTREPKSFLWSDVKLIPSNPEITAKLMREASQFGLTDGFVVPVFKKGAKLGWMSMAGEHMQLTERDLFELEMIATAASLRFMNDSYISKSVQVESKKLTDRQVEVLRWASQGKATEDIAQILGVSKRTVNFHFDQAANNLGTINRAHTISQAFRLGLLQI